MNWHVLLRDYCSLITNKEGTMHFRDGSKLNIRFGTTDKWSVHEIVLRDDYKLDPLAGKLATIVDAGANIGVFSIRTHVLNPQAKIYAFEPFGNNFTRAVENIRMNKFDNKIKIYNMGCSGKKGKRKLYIVDDHRAHSISDMRTGESVTISTDTVGNILKQNKVRTCDLLKLDVEGAEYEIFYSMRKNVLRNLKYISMEYHNLDHGDRNGRSLEKFLKQHDFTVHRTESMQKMVGNIFATNKYLEPVSKVIASD